MSKIENWCKFSTKVVFRVVILQEIFKILKFQLVILFIFSAFATSLLTSCVEDGTIEVKESTAPAELYIGSHSAIFSTIDIFLDAINYNIQDSIGQIKFGKVIGSSEQSKINKDFQKNQINIELDFGNANTHQPIGRLGMDGCYRTGKLKIDIQLSDKNTIASGSIRFDSSSNFSIGNGVDQIFFNQGEIEIFSIPNNKIAVIYNNLSITYHNETLFHSGNLTIELPQNITFDSNQFLQITGGFFFQIGEGILASITVEEVLKKRLSSDCIRPFHSGILNFRNDVFINPIEIIFNPNKEDCSATTLLSISGKKLMFKY